MKDELQKYDLDSTNSIVIGSGILQALGIRKSQDIDLVVLDDVFERLKKTEKFDEKKIRGRKLLVNKIFEIGKGWKVLNKLYRFRDLQNNSKIIDGVRYITLDFLYKVKKSWIKNGTAREKDLTDINLIKKYKKK